MKLTYYGHSCFLVTVQGKRILFDPFITPNPLAGQVDIKTIKPDYIFISHGHFDHINDAVAIAQDSGATVIGGWEVYGWLGKQGLKKVQPLNVGGQFKFEFGTVRCWTAQHSNSLPDGSYGGAACGFSFYTTDGNFYYSGDTALSYDMKLLTRFEQLDFAVLPIGDALTMGVEDAIELSAWLSIKKVLGVHYDTFELIRIDHQKTTERFARAGVELYLPPIGDTIEI